METMSGTMLAGSAVMLLVAGSGFRPMLAVQRGIINARACGYLLREMADGAWARRYRWSECVERARREA